MNCIIKLSFWMPSSAREGANPTVMVFDDPNAWAAYTGLHPILAAVSLTLRLVSAETPGRSLMAKDTAVCEMPSSSAMSLRLTRCGRAAPSTDLTDLVLPSSDIIPPDSIRAPHPENPSS